MNNPNQSSNHSDVVINAAVATNSFRLPISMPKMEIAPLPRDPKGNELPYVVLFSTTALSEVVIWPDVRVDNAKLVPAGTDLSVCMLVACKNAEDWETAKRMILTGGNGEPGTASNGTGRP